MFQFGKASQILHKQSYRGGATKQQKQQPRCHHLSGNDSRSNFGDSFGRLSLQEIHKGRANKGHDEQSWRNSSELCQ